MKAKGFLLTRRARLDLEEIGICIAVDNLERALSFLDELLEVCRGIGAFPATGRVPPSCVTGDSPTFEKSFTGTTGSSTRFGKNRLWSCTSSMRRALSGGGSGRAIHRAG